MDLKRKLIGALFAVIAASGLLIACGNDENSCEFDTDCPEGEKLCHDGFCELVCTSQSDCFDGDVCVDRIGGSGKVCVSEGISGNNNNGDNNPQPECTENEDCDSGVCNQDTGKCVTPGVDKDYVTIEIRDVTTAQNRCTDTTSGEASPATKLSYVQLLDTNGTSLGYGEAVGFNPSADDNAFREAFTVLDGSAPGVGQGQCQESFTIENGIALGCGGSVFVRFLDSNGDVVELQEGDQILVAAYGQSCNELFDKDQEDLYNVYLCETHSTTVLDNSSCSSTPLNPAPKNSLSYVDVSLP